MLHRSQHAKMPGWAGKFEKLCAECHRLHHASPNKRMDYQTEYHSNESMGSCFQKSLPRDHAPSRRSVAAAAPSGLTTSMCLAARKRPRNLLVSIFIASSSTLHKTSNTRKPAIKQQTSSRCCANVSHMRRICMLSGAHTVQQHIRADSLILWLWKHSP